MQDQNVIKGKVEQGRGLVQEAVGDATGNVGDKVAGRTKQVVGKIQEAAGHATDDAKKSMDKEI